MKTWMQKQMEGDDTPDPWEETWLAIGVGVVVLLVLWRFT